MLTPSTRPSTQAAAAAHRCGPQPRPRKKRALRKARKASDAVGLRQRPVGAGKEPASRKGTAASGRANFSRNLSRKLALNLSKLRPPWPVRRAAAVA